MQETIRRQRSGSARPALVLLAFVVACFAVARLGSAPEGRCGPRNAARTILAE